ncbi:N-acetylglucosamine-6-phosphate deacetylase [Scatolibacter rhodanostii]|uniref:N-acetylglucosamine-6-phosphate deacetylase n=1 Tax=Scatolibacter rhodanostii TaxID=2014781 RepID=UPI000C06C68F|nr:N-acetylglucosamine-6-phosphate deacetylase [Scatolibacter rhodanostii]
MKLINAHLLNENFVFSKADIEIDGGRIKQISEKISFAPEETVIDCTGYRIVPGFVDVHIHGCAGTDTMDATRESLQNMAKYLITKGVTSFCPTTMTASKEEIITAVKNVNDCMVNPCEGAAVVGVNMEGPFIAEKRKGAQKADYIIRPDFAFFKDVYDQFEGVIKLVDVAPEEDKDGEFIRQAKELCTVSLAHTTADYALTKQAIDYGVSHITHLYNAMAGFSHREPGVVGAVFEDERVRAEVICDGHHIHPSVLRTTFRILGDRALVVSDSMRAAGLPEGEKYDLGGQGVTVRNGLATLDDGTIAGSVTNLHEEIRNLVKFGIPLEQAIKAATLIPAKAIGLDNEIGSLSVGKKADLVMLDENLEIVAVYHE